MKNLFVLSIVFCSIFAASSVFAADFDALENITPAQKHQLTQTQTIYKQKLNAIDDSLMNYNNKISQVKQDKEKTQEQSSLLISAYERNIETLKNQKKQIEAELDNKYKSIMTVEQYKQYRSQQIAVDNAFSNFLQK